MYAVSLKLIGKKCLVVGGGVVAERKVKKLLDCGAVVTLISPKVTNELEKMAGQEKI